MPAWNSTDPWKGTLEARDDVRNHFEQVMYGRQLTGDVKPLEASPTVMAAADSMPGVAAGPSHDHDDFYREVWGEPLPPEPGGGGIHGSPQLEGPVIDGYATPGAPQIEAPAIEPPTIAPPNQGDDMTPGY